jgi:hypothetical protein
MEGKHMLDQKSLGAKIGAVRRSTASLRVNIQEILCNAAGHAYESGDVTFFDRLLDATAGVNQKLISAWAVKYGFARLDAKGNFKLNKKAKGEADFADGAAVVEYLTDHADPWYVGAPSRKQIAQELDVAKRIENLAKAIEKAANEDKPVSVVGASMTLAMGKLRDALNVVQEKRGTVTPDQREAGGATEETRDLLKMQNFPRQPKVANG